jgi:hypothetical protein
MAIASSFFEDIQIEIYFPEFQKLRHGYSVIIIERFSDMSAE